MAPGWHSSVQVPGRLSDRCLSTSVWSGDDGTGLTRINAVAVQDAPLGELHARWGTFGHLSDRWPEPSRAPRCRREAATRCAEWFCQSDYIAFRPPDGHEILFRALVGAEIRPVRDERGRDDVRTPVRPTNPVDVGEDLSNARTPRTAARSSTSAGSRRFDPAPGDERRRCRSARVRERSGPGWDDNALWSPDGSMDRLNRWQQHPGRPWDSARHGRPSRWNGPLIETGPALAGTARWVWSPDWSDDPVMRGRWESPDRPCFIDPAGGPWRKGPAGIRTPISTGSALAP